MRVLQVLQASPHHLATRYALLIGGSNAVLLVAALFLFGRSTAVVDTILTLLSWAVPLGSVVLLAHLGYAAARLGGTLRDAVEVGVKAGLYLGLQLVVGTLIYLVISGQLLAAGPVGWTSRVATTIVWALMIGLVCALVAGGLALLGAARRCRGVEARSSVDGHLAAAPHRPAGL